MFYFSKGFVGDICYEEWEDEKDELRGPLPLDSGSSDFASHVEIERVLPLSQNKELTVPVEYRVDRIFDFFLFQLRKYYFVLY